MFSETLFNFMFTETRFEFMFAETLFNFMFSGLMSLGNPPNFIFGVANSNPEDQVENINF